MSNNENQTKHCKYCQSEIPAAASVCSQCGRKQKGKLKWVLIVLFALIFLGALGSAVSDSSPTAPSAPADSGTSAATESTQTPPAEEIMEVSPSELLSAYETNEVKADALYDGKKLRISGTVESIGKDILDDVYITFAGEEFSITSVQCYFSDDAQIQQVMELQEGDSVTVVGVCDGYFMNVCVNDCVFE